MRARTLKRNAEEQDSMEYTPRENAGRRNKYVKRYAPIPHIEGELWHTTHEANKTTTVPPPTREHTRGHSPHA